MNIYIKLKTKLLYRNNVNILKKFSFFFNLWKLTLIHLTLFSEMYIFNTGSTANPSILFFLT